MSGKRATESKKSGTSHKSSSAKPAVKPTAGKTSSTKLAGRPTLVKAIDNFLNDHSGFESSVAHGEMLNDIRECTTLNDVFLVPLRHKIINMESALKFILFLRIATKAPIDDAEPDFIGDSKFSTEEAFASIEELYDLGVQGAVHAHVDDALEGDEGDANEEKS